MNKKGVMEISVGTIVTIVLLMTILVLGLVLIKSIFGEPSFEITKEECGKSFNFDMERDYWAIGTSLDSMKELTREQAEYLNNQTFCEEVEVDEVKLQDGYRCGEMEGIVWDMMDKCLDHYYECVKSNVDNLEDMIGECGRIENECSNEAIKLCKKVYEIKTKQNITVEWLDEICECEWKQCKAGHGISQSSGSNEVDWCEEDYTICRKYKCQDYTVEVSNE